MSGLYEQLTETLDVLGEHCAGSEPLWAMRSALRAAVERHKPFTRGYVMTCCAGCSIPADGEGIRYHFLVDHPCEELQDIAEKLGITEQGDQ